MMLALAALPTVIDPSVAMFTTLAVVRSPYALGSTSTRRLRAIATHELLVPRSMPTAISAMRVPAALHGAHRQISGAAGEPFEPLDRCGARAKPPLFPGSCVCPATPGGPRSSGRR